MGKARTEFIHGREHYSVPTKLYGVYRGIVENCSDPLAMGKVQVRVPSIHGLLVEDESKDFIPTLSLPWASQLSAGGGHYDTGVQQVYPCGSVVAVCFENGNYYTPIILGSYSFNCHHTHISTVYDPKNKWPEYKIPLGGGTTNTIIGTTNPSESAMIYVFTPTRGVLHKSFKGLTIWHEEKDNAECFEILDRCGQGIRTETNFSYDDNQQNKSARRIPCVFSEHTFDNVKTTRFMLRDNGLNEIKLEVYSGNKVVVSKSEELRFKLQGTRDRAYWGHPKKDVGIEVDVESDFIRIRAKNIILDGDVKVHDELNVYGNAHFFRVIKSYVRMAVNEINIKDHPPRHEVF